MVSVAGGLMGKAAKAGTAWGSEGGSASNNGKDGLGAATLAVAISVRAWGRKRNSEF